MGKKWVLVLLVLCIIVVPAVNAYKFCREAESSASEYQNLPVLNAKNPSGWGYESGYYANCFAFDSAAQDGEATAATNMPICKDINGNIVPGMKLLSTNGRMLPQFYISDANPVNNPKPIPSNSNVPLSTAEFTQIIKGKIPAARSGCIPYTNPSIISLDDAYVMLGGFMYLKNSLPSLMLGVNKDSGTASYAYMILYPVSKYDSDPLKNVMFNDPVNLSSKYSYLFVSNIGSLFYYDGTGGYSSDFSKVDDRTYFPLSPGVYYVVMVFSFNGEQGDGDDESGAAVLFRNSADSGASTTTAYKKSVNLISNSDFTIYDHNLDAAELKKIYSDDDIEKYFCSQVGSYNAGAASVHNGCCWEKSEGLVGGNFQCRSGTWEDASAYCSSSPQGGAMIPQSTTVAQDIASIPDGSDTCCGDDLLSDLGFISKNGNIFQYLCYNKNPMHSTTVNYNWLNSMKSGNSYKIATVPKSGTSTDAISNGQDWYYCNADGKNSLAGVPIAEYATFPERFIDGTRSCAELYSAAFNYKRIFEEDCTVNGVHALSSTTGFDSDCCAMIDEVAKGVQVEDCANLCYLKEGERAIPPVIKPDVVDTKLPVSLSEGYTDTLNCIKDPRSCLKTYAYDQGKACSEQETYTQLCTQDQYCSSGTILPTAEPAGTPLTSKCCFGTNAKCIAEATVTSKQTCESQKGKYYDPSTNYYSCIGTKIDLSANAACCVGSLSVNLELPSSNYPSTDSFICFKENGQNIISQCCYGSGCKNANYSSLRDGFISNYDKRVLNTGAALHTIENFDSIDKTKNSVIKSQSYTKILRSGTSSASVYPANLGKLTSLENFSYLEFDVLTDSDTLKISLNGIYIGELFDYSTNGDNSYVWHHIVLPLSDSRLAGQKQFKSLSFSDAPSMSDRVIVIDNILVSVDERDTQKLASNSRNYYCTGGFEGWINDLDAPAGSTTVAQYGPYMFACTNTPSYGWTGMQCCGDDTKLSNHGEYFNDTQAGCFGGSKVSNNSRVADVKGVTESTDKNRDRLSSFENKDLLYYDNKFVGCQVPSGKYDSKKVSFDGNNLAQESIVTSNINVQCSSLGDYYCADNSWKSLIPTDKGDLTYNKDMQIGIKFSPAGNNMIKNGFATG